MHPKLNAAQLEQVRRLAMARAQNILAEMGAFARDDDTCGRSPDLWYLEQGSQRNDPGLVTGPMLASWIVTKDSVTTVAALPPFSDACSGMYYRQGSATFYLHPTELILWYDFTVGPRYGRGCQIELAISPFGDLYFPTESPTWMS